MDSLVLLCARCVVTQRPLPALPPDLYPVLFQVAFLEGRPLVLQDLVAAWPFPLLNLQRLLGHRELLWDHPTQVYVQAIIQGVVVHLHQVLKEPGHHSSLCVLDLTGLSDSVSRHTSAGFSTWSSTEALAKACMEVSKHQQELQRCRFKRHKGHSGDTMATLQPPVMDVYTNLVVSKDSYKILRNALQTRPASLLRLKCREFKAEYISASEIVNLLDSLDPSSLRRVDLCFKNLGLADLLVILPYLLRFPELRSLKLQENNVDVQYPTPESTMRIRCLAQQLGMLPNLRELNLRSPQFLGNLHQLLCDLRAPLESLELGYCSLVHTDLTFLSQSFHAPALKKLDLTSNKISQGLLESLQLVLEETSASLLYLDLTHCDMNDYHLAMLLPILLRCSRLRVLRLYGNFLSMAMLKDLLQKTLELPDLHLVVYPIPVDCYKMALLEYGWDSVKYEELLVAATAEISQLLENSRRTDLVWTFNPDSHKALDYFSL